MAERVGRTPAVARMVGLAQASGGISWIAAGVGASFLFVVGTWIARPWVGGDTPFVLDGTNAFLDCLHAGRYVGCGHTGELNFWGLTSSIGDWPLLQHIPDLTALGLGADGHHARTRIFALLSAAGVAGAVVLARIVLVRVGQPAWLWAFLAVVLSSPFLAYGRTTAGEPLAAGILVALVTATVLRWSPATVAFVAGAACLTKETSYPFVAALGLLGLLLARRRTALPIRSHVIWGAVGMGVAVVAASLFNIVRFGSVLNTNYLEPDLHTHGVLHTLENAAALLLSPSGGILVVWPAATLVVLAACVLPVMSTSVRPPDLVPAFVLTGVVAGLTLGLAAWWTPFGWSGYGPRLSLPWVLPLVLLAFVAYGEQLAGLAHTALMTPRRVAAAFGVILVLTLPHIGYMWQPDKAGGFFAQGVPCDAPWRSSVSEWQRCQHVLFWSARPQPLYAAKGLASPWAVATSVVVGLGILGCLVLLRDGLRRPATGSL